MYKYYSKLIRVSSRNGTSALKNHFDKKYLVNLDKRQKLSDFILGKFLMKMGLSKLLFPEIHAF